MTSIDNEHMTVDAPVAPGEIRGENRSEKPRCSQEVSRGYCYILKSGSLSPGRGSVQRAGQFQLCKRHLYEP
jgi:hypothetical protein